MSALLTSAHGRLRITTYWFRHWGKWHVTATKPCKRPSAYSWTAYSVPLWCTRSCVGIMHVFPREPFFKHVTQWVIWCFGFIQLAKGTIAGTHRRNDKQGEGWWRASNLNWGWFFAAWIVLNCLHYHFTPSNSPHLALLVRLNGTGIALVECDFSFWERCISSHFNELQCHSSMWPSRPNGESVPKLW